MSNTNQSALLLGERSAIETIQSKGSSAAVDASVSLYLKGLHRTGFGRGYIDTVSSYVMTVV